MHKEEVISHYRPELAKQLREIASTAFQVYEKDPREFLFWAWAGLFDKDNDPKSAKLLAEASEWYADKTNSGKTPKELSAKFKTFFFDKDSAYANGFTPELPDIYVLAYKIQEHYRPGKITEATAARLLRETYQNFILKEKESLDTTGLTKEELLIIDSFFESLLAPTNNPNIQIHEGETTCLYDKYPDAITFSYRKDTDIIIQNIKNNLDSELSFFETPDEDWERPQKQTM